MMDLENIHIVYVILHYNATEVTERCIRSILSFSNRSQIVVVDNKSPNDSGVYLKEKYASRRNVFVLLNNENLGFAKGNNIGFLYAKNELNADIIVDLNNDVIIEQENFEKVIVDIIDKDRSIAVIAPKVINKLGINQNPFRFTPLSTFKRIRQLISYTIYYIGLNSRLFWKSTIKYLSRERNVKLNDNYRDLYGIVPHGSCVIYTPAYIELSQFAFVPVTFFYGEEDLLYDFVKLLGLDTYYCSDISVLHLEKISTKTVSNNERERYIFQTKNRIHSIYEGIKFKVTKGKSIIN